MRKCSEWLVWVYVATCASALPLPAENQWQAGIRASGFDSAFSGSLNTFYSLLPSEMTSRAIK